MRWIFSILTPFLRATPTTGLAQNNPPVVNAGPDQTVFVGEVAFLQGSATALDGHPIIEWSWVVDSAPTGSTPYISGPNTPNPLFQGDIAGNYVLSFTAKDSLDWSDPDLMTIHVMEKPPIAVADADPITGEMPLTVQFDGTGSRDPEGSPLTYEWDFGDGTPRAHEASPTHVYEIPGDFTARLIVTNERGAYDIYEVIITVVLKTNNLPVVDAGPDQTVFVGEATLLPGSATAPDGDPIVSWLWTVESSPAGSTPYISDPNTPDLVFRGDIAGDYALSLMVSDGVDWSDPDLVTIHVVENQPPVAVAFTTSS